jgi:hypothetical protein
MENTLLAACPPETILGMCFAMLRDYLEFPARKAGLHCR